jgi:peptide/nickel transport system substrate-binding protein
MLPVLEKDRKLKIERRLITQAYHLAFGYDREPFNDTHVRKAINYAIDKESIARVKGTGKPATGLFPPTVDYVTPDNSYGYPYEPEKAKQLLAEAGWKDTDKDGLVDKGGKPLEVELVYQTAEFPEVRRMCQLIQEDLRKVGIKVRLLEVEAAAYYEIRQSRKVDLLFHWTWEAQWSPEGFLTYFFIYPSRFGDTALFYGNPELNKLINQVLATRTEEERVTIYNHIFKLMYDEAACVPLYYCEEIFVMNSHVQGFEYVPGIAEPFKWEKLWVS